MTYNRFVLAAAVAAAATAEQNRIEIARRIAKKHNKRNHPFPTRVAIMQTVEEKMLLTSRLLLLQHSMKSAAAAAACPPQAQAQGQAQSNSLLNDFAAQLSRNNRKSNSSSVTVTPEPQDLYHYSGPPPAFLLSGRRVMRGTRIGKLSFLQKLRHDSSIIKKYPESVVPLRKNDIPINGHEGNLFPEAHSVHAQSVIRAAVRAVERGCHLDALASASGCMSNKSIHSASIVQNQNNDILNAMMSSTSRDYRKRHGLHDMTNFCGKEKKKVHRTRKTSSKKKRKTRAAVIVDSDSVSTSSSHSTYTLKTSNSHSKSNSTSSIVEEPHTTATKGEHTKTLVLGETINNKLSSTLTDGLVHLPYKKRLSRSYSSSSSSTNGEIDS